ncbi:flagellar hook protein FlgE [Rhodoferax mekongensis]|uniref:Flagellar hook protein FlgE n=1 Tax=Rhodoferax mekongensis TaxID=3068341 RepID=A0ABZ0AZ26_9BURK|nr:MULTISPECIES: flagellar hook protein FlgE [unclassified Rhodoferax]MDT7514259.1 flagellar hook protein FlgE [Rhodoferax sp. TBRC 17199]NBW51663.1 flagellar hook protein FlgE [Betaproteobacteria bacterium]WNO04919.1 flagellar hook protein FlgE [Rhodoferax sp. TBRC 17307]
MSFQTGLSGLNGASKSLDVIGNNIANANTVGMKYSRTEFSALVASQLGAAGGGAGPGIGVAVGTIAQQFTQGNISITGNNLDVAINGGGFFQITLPDQSTAYTRDGQFKLDSSGNLVTNGGANVMGYPTDLLGNRTSITPQNMVIPTNAPIPAQATTAITAEFNLDARTKPAAQSTPPTPISTYGTTMTAFDSQGNEVPVSLYFVKTGPDTTANPAVTVDTWDVFDSTNVTAGTTALNANAAIYATHKANAAWNTANPGPDQKATFSAAGTGIYAADPQLALGATGALFQLNYDVNGKLTSPLATQTLTLTSPNTAIGTFTASLDLSKTTQYGTAFAVSNLTQDGYTAGDLTGITIDESGVITTRYSNGETQARGQLLLADFRNVQGLTQIGGGNWIESYASGQPMLGNPGLGKFGGLRSGSLEDSNVDLTGELVNMMTAQRNYQANAQTIKTQDQIMSTLVNLR